jgi:hypothetical protein
VLTWSLASPDHPSLLLLLQTGKFIPEKSNIWRDCCDGMYDWVKEHIMEVSHAAGHQPDCSTRPTMRQQSATLCWCLLALEASWSLAAAWLNPPLQ